MPLDGRSVSGLLLLGRLGPPFGHPVGTKKGSLERLTWSKLYLPDGATCVVRLAYGGVVQVRCLMAGSQMDGA